MLLPLTVGLILLSACKPQSSGTPGGGTGSTAPSGGAACDVDFVGGRPQVSGAEKMEALCHHNFEVLFNPATLDPVYSAEHLTVAQQDGTQARSPAFTSDPLLPENEQVPTSAYNHSGYDRGHLSPAADFKGMDADVMAESFYTSNIAPQNPTMNRDAWAGVEAMVRACAKQQNGVYVITGVDVPANAERLGGNGPAIPEAYWKVIYTPSAYRALYMPNVATPKMSSYQQFYLTLSALEQKTGVRVAPGLNLNRDQGGTLCNGVF